VPAQGCTLLFFLPRLRLYIFYQTAFHLDNSFICWFRVIRAPFSTSAVSSVSTRDAEEPGDCGSGVLRAEEIDGVGDKGQEIPQSLMYRHTQGPFWRISGLETISLNC